MSFDLQRWYRVAGALPVLAIAYYVVLLAMSFRRLPVAVPVHFGFDGSPNGWMDRRVWVIVSPVILASLMLLVMTTRPIGAGAAANVTTIMFWWASGLAIGSFVEIVRSARAGGQFRFLPMIVWMVLLPVCETGLAMGTKTWWAR